MHGLVVQSRSMRPPLIYVVELFSKPFSSLTYNFSPGREGNLFAEWFSSQPEQISIRFNGNSFLGCLFVHIGQKMANAISASSCFLLMFKMSICRERVCNISLLKSSNIFPISPFMDVLEEDEMAIG